MFFFWLPIMKEVSCGKIGKSYTLESSVLLPSPNYSLEEVDQTLFSLESSPMKDKTVRQFLWSLTPLMKRGIEELNKLLKADSGLTNHKVVVEEDAFRLTLSADTSIHFWYKLDFENSPLLTYIYKTHLIFHSNPQEKSSKGEGSKVKIIWTRSLPHVFSHFILNHRMDLVNLHTSALERFVKKPKSSRLLSDI